MDELDIEIKHLRALDDLRAVVELQKTYWGDDTESVVPAHMLFTLAHYGGHVLGAYVGDTLVGALIGLLGTDSQDTRRPAMANLQIVSKRMIVLPEYRGQGIGYRLKMTQRDIASQMGVRLVTWTFDPLLAANARLNIRKLGGIAHRYLENYYGTSGEGGLARLGSSDRLLVEWWVTSRRVDERIFGKRVELSLRHYLEANTTILNPTTVTADGIAVPPDITTTVGGSLALLEIPVDFIALEGNTRLAETWRRSTRAIFRQMFAEGFIVTDFLRESHEGRERAFYLMSYNGPQFEMVSMN
ncbi:MAG: GNAT family N-acetyltransferase [Chloroflexota bacterium]|nr:GNAT family N-acetyltransferase [Chloroflexota bacterium]